MKSLLLLGVLFLAQSEGARFLGLFPLQGKSHFIMMEQLMKELARRGDQVDVVSHFPQKTPFPNYKDIDVSGTVPIVVNNMSISYVDTFNTLSVKKLVHMAGTQVCQLLGHPKLQEIIKNPPKDPPYDAVIVEVFASHCYFAFGRLLNVPVIGVTSSGLYDWMNEPMGNPSNPAYIPGGFTGFPAKMTFIQRLSNTLISLFINFDFQWWINEQSELIEKYFGPDMPKVEVLQKELTLLLVNSHFSLNGVRPLTSAIVEVGGLHVKSGGVLPQELQKWLDDSKHGVVYFSFGSMMKIESLPEKTLLAFYETFRKIAPVRVLMKIPKVDELPKGLPENVKTMQWIPQVEVLEHKNVKVFITHGGNMGTLEALRFGVPLIGFPLFGDQHANIQNFVNRNIAIALDYKKVDEKQLTEAITTILKDPSYKKNAENLSRKYLDRPLSAMDTAIFWIKFVLRNGNVLRSPSLDLTWWQVNLLDVYGVLLGGLLLTLYILQLVLRGLWRLLKGSSRGSSGKSATSSRSKKTN
ncbi:UDP-glucuronosyltransferase 2B19 [Orussus abietinus]|uniref:UDP-glucuronosyltransferase 2B19 n=1 Tax=Orussus abietinus TaxID=222816 RepID=UPI00062624A4|nr:UDP-glucuronosyltransferase 2B19 [Orussus abietinus]